MLIDGEKLTWFCKLVRLSVGVLVNVTQFVAGKSQVYCITKFVEGIIQERI